VYRLLLEPKRLFRRYVLGNLLFLGKVARERIFTRR
jgi:UDP-N-acetyl-D-mannosaminuronic acid transferase (WecB/TagA/CpsF family)